MSGFDPLDSKVELEVLRERLKNTEERVRQQEKEFAQVYTNLGRKETELIRIRDERDDLRIKWEVVKRDLKHTQELLLLSNQKTLKKRRYAKFQAFAASVTFFVSSVLVNVGTNVLTSTPTNSLGRIIFILAIGTYLLGALLTTLLAFEGGN